MSDRAFDRAERVDVLYFDLGPEDAFGICYGNIRFDAHLPFLEIRLPSTERSQKKLELACETSGSVCVMDDRFSDELHERDASTIEIDETLPVRMYRTCRVFFKMDARDRDARKLAAFYERIFVLADLVSLRDVRIEIALAIELGEVSDRS